MFDDEFDGAAVDYTKWETKLPYDPPYDRAKPYESSVVYLDQNVTVGQGYATIQVREEANPVPYGGASGRFTGGVLFTKSLTTFNKGRFEIRCRFPVDAQRQWLGYALWPAFWLIGGECGREEIDIFELNDLKPADDRGRVVTTLHGIADGIYDPDNGVDCSEACIGATPRALRENDGYFGLTDGNFHTFALEWEPACITWFVDGVALRVHHRFYDSVGHELGCPVPAGNYFQHPVWPFHNLQMVIDMKLGKKADDEPPGRAPANLDIDYVRVYQRIPANDPKNLCGGTVTGQSVVCNGDTYTAAFRSPTTQINWTCSGNLVLSGTTGSTVTVSPAAAGLAEQDWVAAEPVFQSGILCTGASSRIKKDVWIGLPITNNNLAALLAYGPQNPLNQNTCQDFALCANIPGSSLMGVTYAWTMAQPTRNRPAQPDNDKPAGPDLNRPAPGEPPCNCAPQSTSACVSGSWYNYPGANASVPYTVAITNRCGTTALGGSIFRDLNCPGPAQPPIAPKAPPSLLLYPNPANSTLRVKGTDMGLGSKFYLYNAYGNAVFEATLGVSELLIDTGRLPSGAYFLKVIGPEHIVNRQVWIDHKQTSTNP